MTDQEIRDALERLPGWSFQDGALRARYAFASNIQAGSFLKKLKAAARARRHQVRIVGRGSAVAVAVPRADRAGFSEADFDLARDAEALRLGPP